MQARETWSAGQGDDKERFLADLRALRDTAALGYDELAARAHYPSDILKEAEYGPSLPGLPILAAYVRACEGDVPEWEERWRRLGYESWADPGLPVRPAGASPAAVAGARAGIGIAPPEVYDPERIRAALRGHHRQADRSAREETAAGRRGTSANGDQHAGPRGNALPGPPVSGTADYARNPESIRHDPFSAAWLHDGELMPSRTDSEPGRPDRADDPRPARQDSWFTPPKLPAEAAPEAAAGLSHRIAPDLPRHAGPDDPQPAGPDLPHGPGGDLPRGGAPHLPQAAGSAAPAQSQHATEPAVPQTAAAEASQPRRDRLYPLRLLVVIVVAALIGSILVLLIR